MIRKVSEEVNHNYPFDPAHFFYNEKQIDMVINRFHPKTVCELGAMLGASTRYWAERVDSVLAVDHWDWKRFESLPQDPNDPPQNPSWPIFYEIFVSNCYHKGLQDKISTLRMTTVEAAEFCKSQGLHFDVIYIDAAHASDAVARDIDLWLPLGDIICGDDWGWVHEPFNVHGVVKQKAKENGFRVFGEDNFWMFERNG